MITKLGAEHELRQVLGQPVDRRLVPGRAMATAMTLLPPGRDAGGTAGIPVGRYLALATAWASLAAASAEFMSLLKNSVTTS